VKSYIKFLNQHKIKLIVSITMLVALLSISLKDLAFEGSYRIWFDPSSKIMKDYDKFRSTFSGDDTFIMAFEDKEGIFRPKPIETILELTQKLKMLDGVRKVDSLTNYQHIRSVDDDVMVEDFIYDIQEDLEAKKKIAINDKLILHQLINDDATATMIAIKLSSSVGADEEVNIYVMEQLENIRDEYEAKTGYTFYISGLSAVTASLVNVAVHDALVLIPLAVVIVVVLLFLLFRDPIGVAVPAVVILFTSLLVLSMQMLLGHKLNNFTVNIPSFVAAIAIADSMHLFLAWVYYRTKDIENQEALYLALKNNFLPIAMTSLTTAIGFATLSISAIEPIATLGIAITAGALIAFLLSVTLAPAILLLLNDNYKIKPIKFLNLLHTKGYGAFIVRNDKQIVVGFAIVMLLIGYGLTLLKVDSNSIKYFDKSTTVRSGSEFIEEKLTGSMIYEIILDSKAKEGAKSPAFLEKIVTFEKALITKHPNVTFTTSLKDIVEKMHGVLDNNSTLTIPNSKNAVAQYLLLYSMSLPQGMELNDKIDTTERYLRLSINSNIQDSSKDLAMIDWVEKWWEKNSNYSATVQGQTSIFAYMQSSVMDTLLLSISATLILVLFAMFFIFRNIKMLWIFILPNLAPILLVGGVMGYLGRSVDIGVAISASVILGIAVDDTIHFFSKYFQAIKTMSFEESIDYVISHSGNAMILTTFILSFTFAIFGVSSFVPNVNFAIVTVVALNIALLLDLILLPALLSLFYNKK
jgi:predicted RND superfamily exporter protein